MYSVKAFIRAYLREMVFSGQCPGFSKSPGHLGINTIPAGPCGPDGSIKTASGSPTKSNRTPSREALPKSTNPINNMGLADAESGRCNDITD